jgi:hypothetical protein
VLHGGVQQKARRAALQRLSDLPCDEHASCSQPAATSGRGSTTRAWTRSC